MKRLQLSRSRLQPKRLRQKHWHLTNDGYSNKEKSSDSDNRIVIDPQLPPLTARRAAYLLIKRAENRDADEVERVALLAQQHPDLASVIEVTDEFLDLLRHQQVNKFDTWLFKVLTCRLRPLRKFAEGLLDDYAAVKASLMLPVSNSPVERLNNRLKMLKRQMYGRAGQDLLAKRLIAPQPGAA